MPEQNQHPGPPKENPETFVGQTRKILWNIYNVVCSQEEVIDRLPKPDPNRQLPEDRDACIALYKRNERAMELGEKLAGMAPKMEATIKALSELIDEMTDIEYECLRLAGAKPQEKLKKPSMKMPTLKGVNRNGK